MSAHEKQNTGISERKKVLMKAQTTQTRCLVLSEKQISALGDVILSLRHILSIIARDWHKRNK